MSPRRRLVLLALLAVAGCDAGTVDPNVEAGLALQIILSPELASTPDAGTLHVEGPTSRTVPLAPGASVTVENLLPGAYTLALEAFASGQVVGFGQTSVTVVAGQNRQATITPANFVPTGLTVPSEVPVGEPVTVTFQGVPGAQTYVAQWADNAQFNNAQSFEVGGTSASFTLDSEGTFFVRVFARTRFGSDGEPTASAQVQVTPSTLTLQDGVPLSGRSGAAGSFTVYTFQVPVGAADRVLQFRVRGGTGNPDLYVRQGSPPTTGTFDCRSALFSDSYSNNLDFCAVVSPEAGTWYVGVHGAEAYDAVTLDAEILPYMAVAQGVPVDGLSGATSEVRYFTFDVPASGVSSLHLATSGGSGDADLFAAPAAAPFSLGTAASWPCQSRGNSNDEVCDIDAPQSGPWTIFVVGFADFTGVSLEAAAVPTASPPTISNASFAIVEVNSASCSNGGTSVEIGFDYQDSNGDIGESVPVRTRFTFQPSGTTGQAESDFTADGTGFAGSVRPNYCIVFGTNTQVTLAVSITDMAAGRSNELEVVVPKPTGATAPGRPGGAAVVGR
jgi:hypothetical protein